MIRVLHYGLGPNLGGIETYLNKIYSNINKKKFIFDFLIVGNEKPCFYHEFKKMGSKFYFVKNRSFLNNDNKKQVRKIIRNTKPDITHCHMSSLSYITPILESHKQGIPTIVHSRNAMIPKNILSKISHQFNTLILPQKNLKLAAVSDFAGQWMFGKNAEFITLNNGIDIKKFKYNHDNREKFRTVMKLEEDSLAIVHVGAFKIEKNHDFLIDVFNEILKFNNKAQLILVGEGDFELSIKQKVKEFNIENKVSFLGNRSDINFILSGADYFIFPSISEGFPNALLEAQTSGLPCLYASTITKQVDINSNVKRISLEKSPIIWAEKLLQLEKFQDRSNGFIEVQNNNLSVESEIIRLERLYKNLVTKK